MTASPDGPLEGTSPPPPSPFAPTDSVDFSSFSSLFNSKSDDMGAAPTDTSMPADFSSMLASMRATATRPGFVTSTTSDPSATGVSSSGIASAETSNNVSSQSAVTASSTATQSVATTTTAVGTSAAANSASADLQPSSAMSKPGIQAAIAVPIVVFVLALIGLIFFLVRRRKKKTSAMDDIAEKQPPEGAKKKKWSRHLRVFSFDNELLMGGRYSSTNSIRSRQTGSMRSATRSQAAPTPSQQSIHSVEEEVAPPYRDAVFNTQPSISQVMTGAAAVTATGGLAAAGVARSASTATAPPPYASGGPRTQAPETIISPAESGPRNPFLDTPPISPVDESRSPFNDPPGTTPAISRNSSLYQASRDDLSIAGVSDAASIREATLARNASVQSGGRVIQNIRANSSSGSQ